MEVVIVMRTPYSSASLRGLPMMMMIVVAMMGGGNYSKLMERE